MKTSIKKSIKSSQSGITLVEILVATILLLIIIGPLLSFLRTAQLARNTTSKLSDVAQNARAAMLVLGRDIQNAGYNFAPKIELGTSTMMKPLLGTETTLTPVVPGNDLNIVYSPDPNNLTGTNLSNLTDQITMFYNDQTFNAGLPLIGTINAAGNSFVGSSAVDGLAIGDYCVLSQGGQFAIGIATAINTSTKTISFTPGAGADTVGLNQSSGPLSKLNPSPSLTNQTTLYRFSYVSYFVDQNGNLIRREQLPPPHTATGSTANIAAEPVMPKTTTFNGKFYDNIIATGIEDLQFSYYLVEPDPATTLGVIGPLDNPGIYDKTNNKGSSPTYRLLDIRRIKVSLKVRAQERDTKLRDPYNKNQGYLYRFTLEGTFNTRNFYGSNYRPISATS